MIIATISVTWVINLSSAANNGWGCPALSDDQWDEEAIANVRAAFSLFTSTVRFVELASKIPAICEMLLTGQVILTQLP
jgi:hypothetical protein